MWSAGATIKVFKGSLDMKLKRFLDCDRDEDESVGMVTKMNSARTIDCEVINEGWNLEWAKTQAITDFV
jgi:hypothetical protein